METTAECAPGTVFTSPAVDRVAMITVHTSPLSPPGRRDSGGLNVYVRELSRYLSQRGVAVDIFTRRTDTRTPLILQADDGVRVIQVEAGPPQPVDKDSLFCYLPDFASEMAFLAIKEGVRYDLVHAHYWLSGWAAHLLQRYWNAPFVQMFHTLAHLKNAVAEDRHRETTLRLQVERRLVDVADMVIAANPDERDEMTRRLNADGGKISTVPPGVDLDLFRLSDSWEARRALDLPSGPLLLFVGRIDPVKGIDTLFDGLQRLIHDYDWAGSPPRLVFVGGLIEVDDTGSTMDSDLQQLSMRAGELGLSDYVLFRGSQPRQVLPLYYNAVDVCVVPSRYESFGLVAVEAMACGTPIVASHVGGLRFTIEDEVSGLLVPHSDPAELSAALRRALTDHHLRSRMQVGARQAAIRFSWQTITAEVLRVYEQSVLEQRIDLPMFGGICAS
ncbi:MAG TPA: glycosyltransferase [Nitrolancea sp.]|nr:glycosyltransferase [Nitrolancea sp.]